MDLKHAVIDFSMHGDFKADHPLEKSGLLIPDCEDILAPRDLVALDMSGSHVTLRACVLGLVTRITSQEALGCIWAILQTGTTSVLASAWHVDGGSSSGEYTETFYEEWLPGGHIGQHTKKPWRQ
jgi:CHAT domain-containing protein